MGTTQPIRDTELLTQFTDYYRVTQPNLRNDTLIQLGLHTALRISDLLALRWQDLLEFPSQKCLSHLIVTEKKTKKYTRIALCASVQELLIRYYRTRCAQADAYVFSKNTNDRTPLSRSQAYRIVHTAAEKSINASNVSCHSLRKTFGYHAWKQGVPPAMLMELFNHSSYEITKRYLGISQDERDKVFLQIML